jgi:tetratricopeptide (TPR) repeat protein
MELTIEQALQQGIAAHKEGKVQDAEKLYRAILQSQPAHPDANHNLGLIAVSVNKAEAALPLFKTALEANPKIEQYWLSYIDALIKERKFDNAKVVLEQAKNQSVAEEKLIVLKTQLTPTAQVNEPKLAVQNKSLSLSQKRKKSSEQKKRKKKATKQNLKANNPSQQQLTSLLEHYQNRRFNDAKKLAVSITNEFPKHQFAWKVLAAIFGQTGKNSEAAHANQTAVALSPQDAEAYSNLGNSLKELGRLDEAEASYTQAIALKPDYAEAHNNLGATLQELDRLDEAETSYTQAIALKPDYAEACYNLGITLNELGRLNEAEASYKQAITLKPDYAEAHSNLGATLQELGRFSEAEASYTRAIAVKPDFAEAHSNLGNTLKHQGRFDEAQASYTQAIALKPDFAEAHHSLLVCLYRLDKQAHFFDELDYLINQNKANALIGSLICRSALKYGLKRSNIFCENPLKYILHTNLNTLYDFKENFAEKARSILDEKRLSNREQPLLIKGYQTLGNLFALENYFTEEIQKVIRLEIEKYRINFKNSEEGFIKKWPIKYTLYGWLISMKSGGNLQPHIHERGWLSGSIYINVPLKSKGDSGNLVVSLGEEKDVTNTRINENKIINVATGNLVLFPGSLTHYTIPFKSEEERIVLAFDVIPK